MTISLHTVPVMVVPLLWAALVVVGGWRRRPVRSRVPELRRSAGAGEVRGPLTVLGGVLRRLAGAEPDPSADRQVGAVVVAALLAGVVWPPAGLVVIGAGVARPRLRARAARRRRSAQIVAELPELVDLFTLAIGAGLTVPLAVEAVSRRSDGPTGTALAAAAGRARLGQPMPDALARVVDEIGEPARALIGALASTERYGTPLLPALARVGAEARLVRRRASEVAARRLPVQLLFPLVLCTLPAFALLAVAPLLVSAFDSLSL
jgi:tight adherence protein C